jgi:transposase
VEEMLPAEVSEALLPLVRLAEELSDRIKVYDERIEKLGREKYAHTELLRQVKGVGPLTSCSPASCLGRLRSLPHFRCRLAMA